MKPGRMRRSRNWSCSTDLFLKFMLFINTIFDYIKPLATTLSFKNFQKI